MLPAQTLLFVCNVSNDALTILTQQPIAGWHSQRFDSVTAALDAATSFAVGAPGAARPELDGAFFRAFDFEKWEVWASDADAGWGAWSVETGWTAPWIHLSLGLRHANTSLWELGAGGVDAAPAFEEWLPFFFPEGACA